MAETPPFSLADAPPHAETPTDYDWAFRIHYLRLLDADAAGADWREVARLVLDLDVEADPAGAERVWRAHLDRALWMTREGYRTYLTVDSGDCPTRRRRDGAPTS